ncbi:MAG: hypothetical protein NTW04_00860, partial [Elusimicrobia bacterium]|nr:hypothetical protein [Elusimicrobiota bacterium]
LMKTVIRIISAVFWLVSTSLIIYVGYTGIEISKDPVEIWGWVFTCITMFAGVTLLSYTGFSAGKSDEGNRF